MSVFQSIRRQIAPIHPQGYVFIAGFVVATLVLGWLWAPLGWLGAIASLWCAYFFRDPARVTPVRADLVVSPADGRVSFEGYAVPPADLGLGAQPLPRVSIFMSVFDCHVNRAPVEGRVMRVAYRPGLFLSADLDKASEDNERNGVVIASSAGSFGVRPAVFLLYDLLGALISVPIVVTLGYVFGKQLEWIVKYIGGFERLILVVAALSLVIYATRLMVIRKTNEPVSKSGPAEL